MEMLEAALKQSISQCLQENSYSSNKLQTTEHSSDLADAIKLKLRKESQTRAFISQFKIELNNLIGLKWTKSNGNDSCTCDNESEEEDTGHFLSESFEETGSTNGMIKLKCKHSGLYKINQQHQKDNNQSIDSILNSLETEVDDGYRSMNQCNFKNSIIHQLNEIKSRLIDLVHEIDEKVESRLSNVELDYYRRRRNILIEKLDHLLDTLSARPSDSSHYSVPNSVVSSQEAHSSQLNSQVHSNDGEKISNGFINQTTNKYEEQEQIINYSDSSHSSLEDNCTGARDEIEDEPLYRRLAVNNRHGRQVTNQKSLKKPPMKLSTINNQQQHIPSSSTTSTYSTSSHTSSSSFL